MTAWLPPDLGAKLADWWSVADSGTVTQSSGVISQIDDKVSGGFALKPSYSTGPAYSATVMNGYPGFSTNATSSYLQTEYYWAAALNQPFGIHFLLKIGTLPASGDPGVSGCEPGWNGCRFNIDSSGNLYFYAAGAAGYRIASGLTNGSYGVVSVTANATATFASLNGTAVGGSPDPGTSYQSGFSFGCDQFVNFSTPSGLTAMSFGEIIATNTTLTSGEQAQIEGYLAWSAGLASLLPSGHAYKAAAPTTGGGGTTYSPGAGSFAITGAAPALTATQSLSPTAGSAAFNGRTPELSATGVLSPVAGSLSFAGYAPSLGFAATFSPDSGTVAFTGLAPALTGAAALTPGAGAFAVTGRAPHLTQAAALAPGSGSFAFTGLAPAVAAAGALTPAVGTWAVMGRMPALTAVAILAPGVGALLLTGYAPALSGSIVNNQTPGAGSMAFTGHAPALAATFLTWTPVPGVSEAWSALAVTPESWAPAPSTAKIWSAA